jgi:hypothetical protein
MTGKASMAKTAGRTSVGRPFAPALSGEAHNARIALSMAEKFVAGRARDTARMRYVRASFVTLAAFALFGLGLFLLSFRVDSPYEASVAGAVGLATLCGAIGAQFSLLSRLDTLHVNPGAGRDAHDIEAIMRMAMGVFAAIIAVAAVRADIALGFFVPNATSAPVDGWLIPMVALVAGASERFVPAVLLKVET